MLKNYFNDNKLFESVYQMNEDCGGNSGCGRSEENNSSCGGSGCGFRESQKLHECGSSSHISYSGSSCGGSGHYSLGCGRSRSTGSCEIGRKVIISVGTGCGSRIAVGRLVGYAEV